MPKTAKPQTYFDADDYWNNKYADFQKVISQIIHSPDTSIVHVLMTPQVGKSYLAYGDLFYSATEGYDRLPSEGRMKDKLFFTVIPLDNELDKFFGEQFLKPFGKDKDGNIPTNIENIRIPVIQADGSWKRVKLVKRFNRNGVPVIELFNNCKIFFFAADANPEKHLPGYTFYKGVYDEYAKFKSDITHIVSDRLMREKGTLLTVTTLNENDYNNWYTQDIYKYYKSNGTLIIPDKEADLCGLEIYKIETNEEVELNRLDKNGNLTKVKVQNRNRSFLIIGDLEKIYPYAHDGENIYLRVRNHVTQGIKTEEYYQAIHRCNPNVHTNLRILSNYNAENNQLDITGREKEIEAMFPVQAIGFDPGKADGTKQASNIGWARVGMRTDPNNPKFMQFCILESGILNKDDAILDNVIHFLLDFKLPILTDNSIWKVTGRSRDGDIHPIDQYYDIAKKIDRYKEAFKLFQPAGGKNLKNDSNQRVSYWQAGLSVFASPDDKKRYLDGLPFDSSDYVQYQKPFTENAGSQILIATSKTNISLNERLIKEIENWKKTFDKDGKIKEGGGKRSKIDCWDGASLGVDGLIVWRRSIEARTHPKKETNISLAPVRQNFIPLEQLYAFKNQSNTQSNY